MNGGAAIARGADAGAQGAGSACYHPWIRHGGTTVRDDDKAQNDPLERWVERAQAGEVEAFEELYRRHVGRVYALCLRMSGDAGEAEELTQDAFVRAWEKLGGFQGRSAFSSWLHRLTVNVVLMRWRAKGRHRERSRTAQARPACEKKNRQRQAKNRGADEDLPAAP